MPDRHLFQCLLQGFENDKTFKRPINPDHGVWFSESKLKTFFTQKTIGTQIDLPLVKTIEHSGIFQK